MYLGVCILVWTLEKEPWQGRSCLKEEKKGVKNSSGDCVTKYNGGYWGGSSDGWRRNKEENQHKPFLHM